VKRKAATIAIIAALALASACQSKPEAAFDTAILNVTVVSADQPAPLENANVYLLGDRIAAIDTARAPRTARTIVNGEGRYLTPGLIDSHVHVAHLIGLNGRQARENPALARALREQIPRAYLFFGFTTLIDLDLAPADQARFSAAALHPNLYSCGRGLRLADGYGMNFIDGPERFEVFPNFFVEGNQADVPGLPDAEAHTPEAGVGNAVGAGAICIKTYYERGFSGVFDLPVPSSHTLSRIAAAAHDAGLPLVLHATSLEAYRAGLDSGADVLAHGLWHWPGPLTADVPREVADLLEETARRGVFVQPTMRVILGESAEMTRQAASDSLAQQAIGRDMVAFLEGGGAAWSLEELHDAYARSDLRGDLTNEAAIAIFAERIKNVVVHLSTQRARLIFGSDTPAVRGGGNIPGLNGYRELEAWAEAGVPLAEIFAGVTLRNAQAFGLDQEIGAVAVGHRADLLLLSENPLRSVAAYNAVELVVLGGRLIDRAALAAP
jgi:imidazolonepropionase-like amidohydrolase